MEQGSEEWHEWRRGGIGSSDAPTIMGVGYSKPYDLWLEKTGQARRELPKFVREVVIPHGERFEHEAREMACQRLGEPFLPYCDTHPVLPWARASIDGLNFEGDTVIEIKCPWHPKSWEKYKAGGMQKANKPQIQHIHMVRRARVEGLKVYLCAYWAQTQEMVINRIEPEQRYIEDLIKQEAEFWRHVQEGIPYTGRR